MAVVLNLTAKTGNFEELIGTLVVEDERPEGINEDKYEDMPLWIYDLEYNGKIYRRQGFWQEEPSHLNNYRQATISLARIVLQIGLKINLNKTRKY